MKEGILNKKLIFNVQRFKNNETFNNS
jgi:hypothetical protein